MTAPLQPTNPVASADPAGEGVEAPYDPLRLCIFATVALLGWLLGPVALLVFGGLGFAGYLRARRAGLTRSKCFLRDTRLVLGYLALLILAALAGIYLQLV
jgi:hypothetical protein